MRVCHRPANVDHAGRTDLVHASRRSDTTALGQSSLDTAHGATGHRRPTNALSRREGLRLPVADGLRELGATVILYDVEHRRALLALSIVVVEVQGDAAIPKDAEDFQTGPTCACPGKAPASDNDPIDAYRGWRSNVPLGILAAPGQPTVIRIYGNDRIPMVLDSPPEKIDKFRFSSGLANVNSDALHHLNPELQRRINPNIRRRCIYV